MVYRKAYIIANADQLLNPLLSDVTLTFTCFGMSFVSFWKIKHLENTDHSLGNLRRYVYI